MSGRILVAEDEALIAMQLEADLQDAGHEVVGPCLSLGACMDMLDGAPIDAAVLDVDLGGADVFPVAKVLSERGVPFVFHTGSAAHDKILARFPDSRIFTKPTDVRFMLARLGLYGVTG